MPAQVETLIEDLTSEDESVRRMAVEDLGDQRDVRSIEPMLELLEDNSTAVREAVVAALSRIGGEETVIAVLPALRSDQAVVRNAACIILESIGDAAVDHLGRLVKDEDKDVRKFAVDVLAMIGRPAACAALSCAIQDPDTNVAVAAAEALGAMGSASAVPLLVQTLKANNWMRCAVAKSLGRIGGADARRALLDLIGDHDEMVVFVAVQALGVAGDENSLQHLLYLLSHGNPMVVNATVAAIELVVNRTGPEVLRSIQSAIPLEPIAKLAGHAAPAMRGSAIALLGKIGNASVLPALVAALVAEQNRDEPDIRAATARSILSIAPNDVGCVTETLDHSDTTPESCCELIDLLGRLGRPTAFDKVARFADHADARVRRVVARVLGGLDPARAGAILCRCLTDRDGHVRAHSARGLGSMLAEHDIPKLVPLFEDPCEAVREAAAWAVSTIGGRQAIDVVPRMAKLLHDIYPDVREAAARGLAAIGDEAALTALIAAAGCGEDEQRLAALLGLGAARATDTVDAALRLELSADSDAIRIAALRALTLHGSAIGDCAIQNALSDANPRVRRSAVKLLAVQAGDAGLERLAALLLSDRNAEVRGACARGLGRMKDPAAAVALCQALGDADVDSIVAIAALDALGLVAGPDSSALLEFWAESTDGEVAGAAARALVQVQKREQPAAV